jgi:hypothetical protein
MDRVNAARPRCAPSRRRACRWVASKVAAPTLLMMGCVEGRRTNLAHASLCGHSTQRSGLALLVYLFEVPKYACSWRGAVSVGRGVLDVHMHRTASSSMLMCHQADSGSIICANASRCEATDLRQCRVLALPCSLWATKRRSTGAVPVRDAATRGLASAGSGGMRST